jgi:RNA polymerase sigma-54 factor
MKGRLELVSTQNVKQIQRLILSPQMQQALHLLQLPVLELGSFIEQELTQNPLLESAEEEFSFSEEEYALLRTVERDHPLPSLQGQREDEDLRAFIENTIVYENSLFEHLMQQAHETFMLPEERRLAAFIIGNLDHDGILSTPLEEVAALSDTTPEVLLPILHTIQTFDPLGVGAQNLKEALLIQLRGRGREGSLALRIVENHYEDVMHNRIPAIAKALSCSVQDVRHTILHEIAPLDLHPGTNQTEGHYSQMIHPLTPDVIIDYGDNQFSIEITNTHIPHLRINTNYLRMLQDDTLATETRNYIHEKIASGKWLLRNIHERHQTLYRITQELIKDQAAFLTTTNGKLAPRTMKEIAERLGLHESTIARAVANKYVSSPRGILPLRSFFTHAYVTESGENISARTVKDLLIQLLANEDKSSPLSDETLSALIKERGIPCARRTVAKYRQELGIGNTTQRRIH